MAFPLSSCLLLLQCLLLFLHPFTLLGGRPNHAINVLRKSTSKPQILPLRTSKIPSCYLPRQPNKLLFHHNVSLTVSLQVGSPPQNVTMVLDTGSELSWLVCNSSTYNNSFKSFASTTYNRIPCNSPVCQTQARDLPIPPDCDQTTQSCHVSISYADMSSSSGLLSSDQFHLGNAGTGTSNSTPVLFGCMDSTYDSTETVTTGLLGMNRGSLSFVTQTGTKRFSYCISDRDDSGILLLGGGANISLPFTLPLNYTPLVQISMPLPYFDRVAYSVQLQGIRVSNLILNIPKYVLVPDHTGAGQTMVDSGTQFTFLLGEAYIALKNEFLLQTSNILPVLKEPDFVFQGAFDTCFRLPRGTVPPVGLPEVGLVLQDAEVVVTGEKLLYRVPGEYRGGDAVWCLTFGNSDLVPLSAYIIGHHHQQNVWVEYDLENGRLGLAPVRCDLATQRLGQLY